ncbi:hypothetical protein [Barnesiella sp. An55]|uniref:hypothetical protein n=1 Tax=Barnesiella sp. An55 TaxID=1965646 RepID=UPI000B3A5EE9|nr:hypothetical protein [Barnesiella sp. An55]OUN70009.1 hypothetical protein B5G10_10985 [Barnesiella sp. An55]
MKVKEHSHLRGQNGCLGFFYGLDAVLSEYPEGGLAGEFFINGETQSIWVWDSASRLWYDTNHAAPAPFCGVVSDPATFSPPVGNGESACYVYIAGHADTYTFPRVKGLSPVSVTTDSAAIITLVWDSGAWHSYVTPLTFDDAIRPTYMYRGMWMQSTSYCCMNGVADVVYYQGAYYAVKPSVSSTTQIPTTTSDWEAFPRFQAIATTLEMLPNQIMLMNQQQTIRVASGESSWDLCNGEIRHLESGTFLSQAGDLRVFSTKGNVVISPNGCISLWRNNKKELIIDWNDEGQIEISMTHPDSTGADTLSILPHQITLSRTDGNGQTLSSSFLSALGLNCKLKQATDTLEEGDIYVDENNFLKQKRG